MIKEMGYLTVKTLLKTYQSHLSIYFQMTHDGV